MPMDVEQSSYLQKQSAEVPEGCKIL